MTQKTGLVNGMETSLFASVLKKGNAITAKIRASSKDRKDITPDSTKNCRTNSILLEPNVFRTPTSLARFRECAVERFIKLIPAIKITSIAIKEGHLVILKGADGFGLIDEQKFIGHRGEADNPSAVILKNNNLHIEILRDPRAFSAQQDPAKISDIIVEAAVSTICDNEDSVAAVDAADKIICYRNWLGLMKGDLKTKFEKDGKLFERKLNPNRSYISKDGKGLKLHGRSLLLIRNVGHLMTNPSIILSNGNEVPEGIMDAFITSAAALHDIKNKNNSRTGSIYIVKPKMHGPDETAFTNLIMLVTPAIPTITTTAPTCAANGFTTISNYSAANTYTFSPVGPTAGAGGTITGAATFLKEKNPNIRVVAVQAQKNHLLQGLRNFEESSMPDLLAPLEILKYF